MRRIDRPWILAGLLGVCGLLGLAPGPAEAQYVTPGGSTVVLTPTAPLATSRGYHFQPNRRPKKVRRYSMRPNYEAKPGFSFAPYSDRYVTDGRFNRPVVVAPPVVIPAGPR